MKRFKRKFIKNIFIKEMFKILKKKILLILSDLFILLLIIF